MRKLRVALVIALMAAVGALATAGAGTVAAWGPPDGGGGRPGGMMGGPGGMMGGGYYGGPGMMGGWYGSQRNGGAAINLDQAEQAVQAYIGGIGNPDLALDEIMEFQANYYAIAKEKSTGIGAFELLVNKYTGNVFPEYGPNMMWNIKYGMMGGGMMGGWYGPRRGGPNNAPAIAPDEAKSIAQHWLDRYQPGLTTEEPDQFYGYYTLHTLKDGKVDGMLSVNAYTGQVWYHTWHGSFVQMKEMDE
ncbi:MAG: PepSY domain-containing protein [Bacteroidetes bacterium]|nr:PepSY domain-containing protein [Bacteroidota bacterium]MCL5026694.1 PepSY domain-containing protein [Chloroflexota bacterium]